VNAWMTTEPVGVEVNKLGEVYIAAVLWSESVKGSC